MIFASSRIPLTLNKINPIYKFRTQEVVTLTAATGLMPAIIQKAVQFCEVLRKQENEFITLQVIFH